MLYPQPTVGFPASSPYVTSVGGTTLYADTSGRYQLETTWDDADGATGGAVSQYFAEPGYQAQLPAADQRLLACHRGVPDVAFNADPETGVPVHLGFLGAADDGYYIFGGTSEGSPAWAGVVADLDQRAGAPLGFLNPSVDALGAAHLLYPAVAQDVQFGSNAASGVPGHQATPGRDPTAGWGTPNLGLLGDLLVQRVELSHR